MLYKAPFPHESRSKSFPRIYIKSWGIWLAYFWLDTIDELYLYLPKLHRTLILNVSKEERKRLLENLKLVFAKYSQASDLCLIHNIEYHDFLYILLKQHVNCKLENHYCLDLYTYLLLMKFSKIQYIHPRFNNILWFESY